VSVPVEGTGTAFVAPVMALPVLGVQKPPRQVGKRFWDCLVAAPEGKVKKPAGLKTRPAWSWQDAWVRTRQSAAAARAARCGAHGRASLEAADSVNLDMGPDSERLKGWDDAAPTDLDEGGGEEVAWQLVRQLGARIVPRQRNSRNIQDFCNIFDNRIN
jgi:hypothetical protein